MNCRTIKYQGFNHFSFKPKKKKVRKNYRLENEKYMNFINWFNKGLIKLKGSEGRFKPLKSVRTAFIIRMKEGYVSTDYQNAINAISNDDYHRSTNFKYITPLFLTRQDILEKWSNAETKESVYTATTGESEKPKIKSWGK